MPELTRQYASGNLSILVISGEFLWDWRNDIKIRRAALKAAIATGTCETSPTVVVSSGSVAEFALEAFLDKYPHMTKVTDSRNHARTAQLYQDLTANLRIEAGKGRILLVQFVDAETGKAYIADLTHVAMTFASPEREALLRSIILSTHAHDLPRRRQLPNESRLVSGAVSADVFHLLLQNITRSPDSVRLRFRLLKLPDSCGPYGCRTTGSHRAAELSMRSILRESVRDLASSADGLFIASSSDATGNP